MKNWIMANLLYVIGAIAGALGGFLYWKYVGCITGSCAITSKPLNSSLYFAFLGSVLFGFFKKKRQAKQQD